MDAATDWVVSGGRYGLDLDGSNDFINLGVSRISGSEHRSVSLWARFYVVASGGVNRIVYSSGNTASAGTQFEFGQSGIGGGWYFQGFSTNATFTAGDTNLHHHCLTYNGATLQWWIDGVSIGTASLSLNTDGSVHNIGRDIVFNSSYFQGFVDDLRIYNRVLPQHQIRLLASRRGIAYERRKRKQVYFGAAFFNPAWARNSNVLLSPVGAA